MAGPHLAPTTGNAVPNVDDTDLGGLLADLRGVHAGIELILDGLRLIAHDRHSIDRTQTLIATLAGNADCDLITAIAHTVQRLASADTNPALRTLPLDQQKQVQRHGEQAVFDLTDPYHHQQASEACAAIDGI
ncbi:hypothetical protein ABZ383_30455 [Streptomyces sp. NPDC005900]|uniref:hypothetical protein n=1 Tax=Streptomyces sp. NPDC005900 TaxID=3154569 RepID=UPI0033C56851